MPAARTADEYAKAPGESWVPRKAIFEAFVRSFGSVEKNSDKIRKSGKFIYHTYDKYVHGSYLTAVDLYSGDTKQFMLHGHNGGGAKRSYAEDGNESPIQRFGSVRACRGGIFELGGV